MTTDPPCNLLRTARIQPIAVPLWYGCEVPGTDHGAIALRDGLEHRWMAGVAVRLRPAASVSTSSRRNRLLLPSALR